MGESALIDNLAKLLVTRGFAYGVIGAIVALSLASGVWLRWRTQQVLAALQAARNLVETTTDKADFAQRFDEISSTLTSSELLGHSWQEFLETLVPREIWSKQEIANTAQPGGYFDVDQLLESKVNRRYFSSLPNILVGAGLFFTFLGLAAGIQLSSAALTAAPSSSGLPADVMEAFGRLLGGAFLSFAKSAAGIFFSICFGLYDSHRLNKVEQALTGFSNALEARLTLVTPERLAVEQLGLTREHFTASRELLGSTHAQIGLMREQLASMQAQAASAADHLAEARQQTEELAAQSLSAKNQLDEARAQTGRLGDQLQEARQQTGQLKHFSTDLAMSVTQALEQKAAEHVAPALRQVIDVLSAIQSDRGSSNERALQGLVSEFQQSLSGAAGTEMTEMAQTLGGLRATLEGAVTAMAKTQEDAAATSSRLNAELEMTLGKTQQALNAQASALSEMARSAAIESGNAMRSTMDQAIAGMAQTLESSRTASAASTAQLNEFVGGARAAMAAQLEAVTGMIRQTSVESQTAVREHLEAAGQVLAKGTNDQAVALADAVRGLKAVTESWGALLGQTRDVVAHAGTTVESFTTTGDQFGAISVNLAKTAAAIGAQNVQLIGHADASSRAVVAVNASAESIQESLKTTTAVWAEYGKRFEGIDESLGQTFRALDEGLTRYATSVRAYLSEVDKNLGEAAGALASAVSPLSEDLQDLPDHVKRFSEEVEKLRLTLERAGSR